MTDERIRVLGPNDPRNILVRLGEHRRQMDTLATELETKGKIGRILMLRTNPGLKDHLQYRAAQQSIVDARLSAAQHEGNIVIP